MTPKEKAKDLYNKFNCHVSQRDFFGDNVEHTNTKECVLIAVNELIESHLLLTTTHESEPSIRCKTYWKQVKQEIENL